jgi:hypothetical protein
MNEILNEMRALILGSTLEAERQTIDNGEKA